MPELPEVEVVRLGLEARLLHKQLEAPEIYTPTHHLTQSPDLARTAERPKGRSPGTPGQIPHYSLEPGLPVDRSVSYSCYGRFGVKFQSARFKFPSSRIARLYPDILK